jgi:F-type H+-transporting ATPase subunit delta
LIAGSLAKRYARALVEVSPPAELEAIGQEVAAFLETFRAHTAFRLFLINPSVLLRDKLALFQRIADTLGLLSLTTTFLKIILEADRMRLLENILQSYQGLVDERLGRLRAVVTVPGPMDPATQDALRARLGALAGKTVYLEVHQDPAILGGLVAQIGSQVYDGSLRTQLHKLHEQLARG